MRGGYLNGMIKVPKVKGKLMMVIQTQCIDGGIHPCLIHVRRGHGKEFKTHLEPEPSKHHWKQTFEIDNEKVKIKNTELSDTDIKAGVPEEDEVTQVQGSFIRLGEGRKDLKLMIIQPTIDECKAIIDCRIPSATSEYKRILQDKFTKNRKNRKMVRLQVDFYNNNEEHCGFAVSPIIVDSNDKDVGPLEFSEVHPSKSCINGGRKIVMISVFDLAKDVMPVFQVFDEMDLHRNDLDNLLIQPEEYNKEKGIITFISPHQPNYQKIKEIIGSFRIELLGKRLSDGYESNTINFSYEEHPTNCLYCDYNLDSSVPGPPTLKPGKLSARPGYKRRTMVPPSQVNFAHTILRSLSSTSQDNGIFPADETTFNDTANTANGNSSVDQDSELEQETNPTEQNSVDNFATRPGVESISWELLDDINDIINNDAGEGEEMTYYYLRSSPNRKKEKPTTSKKKKRCTIM